MSLSKSSGNMYRWVTHQHTHLGGECPHECEYCYVRALVRRYKHKKYMGPLRLVKKELRVKYGTGKKIFMEHCSDLFAAAVPKNFVRQILAHCREWPDNTYIFQTKNPGRCRQFLKQLPPKFILGTTIETNRDSPRVSRAPSPRKRYEALKALPVARKFVTIEPIMDFDVEEFVRWMRSIRPEFVNIGADSKGGHLTEPSPEKIKLLLAELKGGKLPLRKKSNLNRVEVRRKSNLGCVAIRVKSNLGRLQK